MHTTNRDLRIDLLRTLAIVLMVIYHAAYDLVTYHGWNLTIFEGSWLILARTSLILFLLVSGMSQALSHRAKGPSIRWKRFAQVAAAAVLVSVATYMTDPETYVRFGVLHLIAASALLLPFFARLKMWNALIGFLILAIAMLMPSASPEVFGTSAVPMIVLGFPPVHFQTVDYVPLIPWFGVVLIGYACGYLWKPKSNHSVFLQNLSWPGRHSLAIYLLHQPVLFAVLFVLHL